jgi:hypothetical protein
MDRSTLRRQGKRLGVWVLALLLVASSVTVGYFGTPFHGTDDSVSAVESNPEVTVTEHDGTYTLAPRSGQSETGLVFYPGARVHPDAYLAALAPLVSGANVTVVVPKAPLNLAVLDQGAASPYVTDADIQNWYVGGHSLGGAMACRFARANPGAVDGVVLFAAYCDQDISETGLDVLSVTGSADTVLDREAYQRNLDNLPADATVREIPANHTQFGSYRGQRGDDPSGVAYERVHANLANVTVPWVRNRQ